VFSVVYSVLVFLSAPSALKTKSRSTGKRIHPASLELSGKVAFEGNSLSTIALSQGQRRRLALLGAYTEDRLIYVLDEWAADQDPAFRDVSTLTAIEAPWKNLRGSYSR
jgi:putative ATP-binding cassette transporter